MVQENENFFNDLVFRNQNLTETWTDLPIEEKLVLRSQEKLLIHKISFILLYLMFFLIVFDLAYEHAYLYLKTNSNSYAVEMFQKHANFYKVCLSHKHFSL